MIFAHGVSAQAAPSHVGLTQPHASLVYLGSAGPKPRVGCGAPPLPAPGPHPNHCSWGPPAAKFAETTRAKKNAGEGKARLLLQLARGLRPPLLDIGGRKVGGTSTA